MVELLAKRAKFRLIRAQSDGAVGLDARGADVSGGELQLRQQEMRLGVTRVDVERELEPMARVIEMILPQRQDREIVQRAAVLRIVLERDAVEFRRAGIIALREPEIAEGEVRLGISRNVATRELKFFLGGGEVLRLERLPAGVVSVERPERGVALRP